jgi:uncharacterized membrane protein
MQEVYKIAITVGVSAMPWGEVLLAIPLGIALDLHPLATFIAAVTGNVASVLVLERFLRRWEKLQGFFLLSKRTRWVVPIMNRFGIIGLSAQAPIISGAHAALLLGVFSGVRRRSVLLWLTLSISGWGAAITLASIQGKQIVSGLWG